MTSQTAPASATEPQAAGQPADPVITRDVIQDRWDGLLGSSRGNIDTKLGIRLLDTLG